MSESLYKHARGIEFGDLMQRMRERGYKPADVARLCHLSKAAVSGYLSGTKVPGIRTLIIFRDVVARETGGPSAPASDARSVTPLVEQLRQLEANYPEGFQAVATLVRTLLGTAGAAKPLNHPAPVQAFAEAHTLLDKAEKMADAQVGQAGSDPARSPGTGAPKSPPPSAASARTKKRTAPPGPRTK